MNSQLKRNFLYLLSCLTLALGVSPNASAQVQRSFINTSFEQPVLAGGTCFVQAYDSIVTGWTTTSPTATQNGSCTLPGGTASGLIELWTNNYSGAPSRLGNQFAELNADQASALYQNICINKDDTVTWALSHRGRVGADTMAFVLGDSGPSLTPANIVATAAVGGILRATTNTAGAATIVSCQSGSSVTTVTACTGTTVGTWADYKGVFRWTGTSGVKSVGFGAITTSTGDNTVGNFLDAITVTLKPLIEFNSPPSSGLESLAAGPATLGIKVIGDIATAITVPVTVTGGTATLGTDYTTPGGGATFNVTIPAGSYATATVIPLGITIINDTIPETNETITFSLAPSTLASPYLTASTNVCGSASVLTTTYTIIDDDRPTISINKTRLGGVGTVNFGISGTNGVPAAVTNIATTASNVSATVAALTNLPITTDGAAITITETQPSAQWVLTAASCIDANAGNAQLGNTNPATNLATFTGNAVTIAAANVLHTSKFNCDLTNKNNAAAITVTKTDSKTVATSGGTNTYVIGISNGGPGYADGVVLTDVANTGLTCPAATPVSCAVTAGSAVCPTGPFTFASLGTGITIAAFPNASALQFTYTCNVN